MIKEVNCNKGNQPEEVNNSCNLQVGYNYKLYVGLNDMDSNLPVVNEKCAMQIIINVCKRYFPGYNITKSTGGYKDDDGNNYVENSFVIFVLDVSLETVQKVASILNSKFNQSSILIIRDISEFDFYSKRSC